MDNNQSQATRIQLLQDEKAALQQEKAQLEKLVRQLQQAVADLKEKDAERERRHNRERTVQNKEFLKQHEENLAQLRLIDKREEAVKRHEETLKQAKAELEAEAIDRREKQDRLQKQIFDLHKERDKLLEDIAKFESDKAEFRLEKRALCDARAREVSRMQAEDLTHRLIKMMSVVDAGIEANQKLEQERQSAEQARDEAQAKITELVASHKAELQDTRRRMTLRDLQRSWSHSALALEELTLSQEQEEIVKASSSWLADSAAPPAEGGKVTKKRKRTTPLTESVAKLKTNPVKDDPDLQTQHLVSAAAEAMLKIQGLRPATAKDEQGVAELEDLAFQLHAAERAVLRRNKTKPVMPLLSAAGVLCLIASGGARKCRGFFEDITKRYTSLKGTSHQVLLVLNLISKDLRKLQIAGQADGADKWLPQTVEEVFGADGILEGLWRIAEKSVEAWELLENFQLRARRFLSHTPDSPQSSVQLRLLLYWLCADLRSALQPVPAEGPQEDRNRPWVEMAALLRRLGSEWDGLQKGKTDTNHG